MQVEALLRGFPLRTVSREAELLDLRDWIEGLQHFPQAALEQAFGEAKRTCTRTPVLAQVIAMARRRVEAAKPVALPAPRMERPTPAEIAERRATAERLRAEGLFPKLRKMGDDN